MSFTHILSGIALSAGIMASVAAVNTNTVEQKLADNCAVSCAVSSECDPSDCEDCLPCPPGCCVTACVGAETQLEASATEQQVVSSIKGVSAEAGNCDAACETPCGA